MNSQKIEGAAAILFENRIIAIGGTKNGNKTLTALPMSSVIKEIEVNYCPNFEIKPNWNLPEPLEYFGYIIFKHYVLIFGGATTNAKFVDTIYLLDLLPENQGWRKLMHIKCPIASQYRAVLINDENKEPKVHLFTDVNKWPNWTQSQKGNYYLPISKIMGPEYSAFDLNILKVIDAKQWILSMDSFGVQEKQFIPCHKN